MRIKTLTILLYILAGLIIAIFTSIMTYIIIGKPIKMPMIKQIITVVISVAPAIGIISYFFSSYLSKKFVFIQKRLDRVKDQDFTQDTSRTVIIEINEINQNINHLSTKMSDLITDLKQNNRTLSELLVSMAHDIKTPLTVTLGHIEEIEDKITKKEQLPAVLENMKEELNFINEITVDMLEYIESMHQKKVKSRVNVYSVIQNNIFPILPKLKNVTYLNRIDKNLTLPFNCTDFKRISMNILMNASKYTSSGSITVYNKDDKVYFENSGKEIDLLHRDSIFDPFYTIDKSKNRKKSGFGLGLSIVQNLSKNNGYTCLLLNSDQKRTTFVLEPL